MQTLSVQTVVDYAGGILRQGNPLRMLDGITTDSRLDRPGEIFVALRGENFDGHQFVANSAARGTIGAVVEAGFDPATLPAGYAIIEVNDTLLAYQRIAACYRRSLSAKVVAITGSNGKTSTKDLTAAVLSRKFRVLKTEGNLNNHIGVPLTLLRAGPGDEFIVLEMGMNHPGEIAPLAEMARPDIAIITNIGTAHIEHMGSREGIALEKGMLAEAISSDGCVILPATDDFASEIAARTCAQVIQVGGAHSDIRAEDIKEDLAGSRFTLVADGKRLPVVLPVSGRHMITNALLAVSAGRVCGIPLTECAAALAEVRLTKGRMEWKTIKGLQILDDSYNANPDSMVAALETLARMPTAGRRIAVLGKMAELGSASEAGHHRVGETAAKVGIDQLIGVGAESEVIVRSARDAGLPQTLMVEETEQAADLLCMGARPGDLILIKGSRSAAMERMIPFLEQRFPDTDETAQIAVSVCSSLAP